MRYCSCRPAEPDHHLTRIIYRDGSVAYGDGRHTEFVELKTERDVLQVSVGQHQEKRHAVAIPEANRGRKRAGVALDVLLDVDVAASASSLVYFRNSG